MIDIQTMIQMLRSSDIRSEEEAIAKGKNLLPNSLKKVINQIKNK
tara:strand:+ start:226 stop:360 length:135 start_codon:yes stop_codon:yes gene_type:complete